MHDIIKFRAVACGLKKEFAYGVGFLRSPCAYNFLIKENGKYESVRRNSLAQLIGYDVDGKEVYDGDKIIDKDGNELTACLSKQAITDDGRQVNLESYSKGLDFLLKDVKLKEGAKK